MAKIKYLHRYLKADLKKKICPALKGEWSFIALLNLLGIKGEVYEIQLVDFEDGMILIKIDDSSVEKIYLRDSGKKYLLEKKSFVKTEKDTEDYYAMYYIKRCIIYGEDKPYDKSDIEVRYLCYVDINTTKMELKFDGIFFRNNQCTFKNNITLNKQMDLFYLYDFRLMININLRFENAFTFPMDLAYETSKFHEINRYILTIRKLDSETIKTLFGKVYNLLKLLGCNKYINNCNVCFNMHDYTLDKPYELDKWYDISEIESLK